MMESRVDTRHFEELTGGASRQLYTPGGTSAFWYYKTKNLIFSNEARPKAVFVFFRDPFLTYTYYRTTGRYRSSFPDFMYPSDRRELDNLVSLSLKKKYGQFNLKQFDISMDRFLAIDMWRSQHEKDLRNSLLDLLASLNINKSFKAGRGDLKNEMYDMLEARGVRKDAQTDARAFEFRDWYEFEQQVEHSLLPAFLDLQRDFPETKIVFVRVHRFMAPDGDQYRKYLQDLNQYMDTNKLYYLDLPEQYEFPDSWFGDGDHLDERKKKEWTTDFYRLLKKGKLL